MIGYHVLMVNTVEQVGVQVGPMDHHTASGTATRACRRAEVQAGVIGEVIGGSGR